MVSKGSLVGVLAGIVLVLAGAEFGLRVVGDELPVGTDWPSIETDVKYHQLLNLPEVDVVFLGSSMTEAAIDPVTFAAESGVGSAFNSGLPFSTPFSNEYWLDEVVLEQVEPDLVVIGLTAWSSGLGREADPLLPRLESVLSSEGSTPLALLEYAGVLAEWDRRRGSDGARQSFTDLGHQTGYYDRTMSEATNLALPYGAPEMPADEAEAVRNMIRMLESANVETIVLIEPGRHPGDGIVDYDRYIESIMDYSNSWGVPIVDSFHQTWDRSMFADSAHFNRKGTEAFTAYMARSVAQLTASN